LTGSFLFGVGFAFAAAVQPGPLQAFLLAKVADKGVRATLPAAFAPLISDVPIALLALFLLRSLPVMVSSALQILGGILLNIIAQQHHLWKKQAGRNYQPALVND
jgi:threonine/homoserine/homoserine lactone efflux protein